MFEEVKIISEEEWNTMKLKLPYDEDNVDFKKCDDFFSKHDKGEKFGLSIQDIDDGIYELGQDCFFLCGDKDLIQVAFDRARSYSNVEVPLISKT